MRIIEVPVLIKNRVEEEYTFQEFVFMTKKSNFKYLSDNRYTIYYKLIDKIKYYSLAKDSDYLVVDLIYNVDRFILKLLNPPELIENEDNIYFIVSDYIPDTNGCDFCKYKIEKKDYLLCSFQDDKFYSRSLKKCRFFTQKENK